MPARTVDLSIPFVRYARDARWGQFARRKIKGSMPMCGVCGESFVSQPSKASHLRLVHHAEVTTDKLPNGESVYVWDRP